MRTSLHAKERILERNSTVLSKAQAKRVAKLAFQTGATINDFQSYPEFFDYLLERKKESSTCRIRIFQENIYLWKGHSKTLVTCYPIPDNFMTEIKIRRLL